MMKGTFAKFLPVLRTRGEKMVQPMVLIELTKQFVDAIVESLQNLPLSFWSVSRLLSSHKLLGPEFVSRFVFVTTYCKALENPEVYGITDGPGQLSNVQRKGLYMIADVIKASVNNERDKTNKKLDSYITSTGVMLKDKLAEWITKFGENKGGKKEFEPISWETQQKALAWSHGFIEKYMQKIMDDLRVTGVFYQYVKFTL